MGRLQAAAVKRVVVVGASLAGVAAVESLRRQEYDGRLTLLGDEDHLPYDRPPLSKQVLLGEYAFTDCRLRPVTWSSDLGVSVRTGSRATHLDLSRRRVVLADGSSEQFDGLVVATGSSPVPLPPDVPSGVHTLRTYDDAAAIRASLVVGARVVVVGGGFVGAEVASAAIRLGCTVTMIEALPAPLMRLLGPQLGAFFGRMHADHGVDVRCGVPVDGYEGDARIERVRLADGSAVPADLVVVGIGARPTVQWLQGSGLELGNGVICDASCRTSEPGIVAAGDVASWDHPHYGRVRVEHWDNAVAMGDAAATALLRPGQTEPYAPVPYVWSHQYSDTVQIAGIPQGTDDLAMIDGHLGSDRFFALFSRAGQVTGAIGLNRAKMVRTARAILHQQPTVDDVVNRLSGRPVSA